MGWKDTAYHINNFDAGHTLQAAIGKKIENNFCQPVQKRKRKERQLQNFLRHTQTE